MAIKFFHAGQLGAPQLSGSSGSLITVLDAVLVNGYPPVAVTSITLEGTIATVTCGTIHGLFNGDVVALSGAAQPEYNGEFVVSVLTSTTFTVAIMGSPETPATGTISAKRAPGGFNKEFSGSNKAAYRSNDTSLSCRPYLQVIDAAITAGAAREAQVRGYLTMTDVDTGSEPFPTIAQLANGLYAYKSNVTSTAARPWVLITDGRIFYFQACVDQAPASMQAGGGYLWWFGFGDCIPTRPADRYSGLLFGCNVANMQTAQSGAGSVRNGLFIPYNNYSPDTNSSFFMPRSFNQNMGAVGACPCGHNKNTNSMGEAALFPYPNPPDNGLYLTPVHIGQGGVFRGKLPGVYEPLQGRCLNQFDLVRNVEGYPGRTFIALWGVNAHSTVTTGMLLFDLTGDSYGRWS